MNRPGRHPTVAPDQVQTASTLLARIEVVRSPAGSTPFPTGFEPLDDALYGGVRADELMVVGGLPGVGKSIATLQWARRMAIHGQNVIYLDFQHSPTALLRRLLAIELASLARTDERESLVRLQSLGEEVVLGARPSDCLLTDPLGDEAYHRLQEYGTRIHFVAGSSRTTGIVELADIVATHRDGPTALFVDSLQRMPASDSPAVIEDHPGHIAGALKELAMVAAVPVIAVSACGPSGIVAPRLRLRHLHGAPAVAHEADIAVLLNDKTRIASSRHLELDRARTASFERRVVFSIEKHRAGRAGLDIEFRKDFANARFDPAGQFVTDALVTG